MKKALLLALVMGLFLIGCQSTGTVQKSDTVEDINITGTYTAYIEGDDWGCGVNKIVLALNSEVEGVTKDTFIVEETKQSTDWTSPTFEIVEVTATRNITDAYNCDENGEKVEGASKYVAIEMVIGPNEGTNLLFSMTTQYNTYSDPYELNIKVAEGKELKLGESIVKSFEINKVMKSKVTNADEFKVDTFKANDGIEYDYAYYTPESKSDTLVVWLHGLGEGGTGELTDPYITTLGNNVTSLIGDEFQEIIGGANVLVPQCPTFWMDGDGTGNINGGAIIADGTSYYTESLHELIDSYKKETNSEKVILAGCSNGGYMTLLMALEYGDEYDAFIPICEAIPDAFITDEKISEIKDLPLYFIYSKDDTTVDPTIHEIPTIKRLRDAGASNLHVFESESVVDTSGRYKDEDDNPYQYMGHWSWIYFFNNEADCPECNTSVWQWMSDQIK